MSSQQVVTVTSQNMQAEVIGSDVPVLLDFWAPWCGPCRQVAPILEEIAQEMGGKIKIAKVNIDENQDVAVNYRVSSIPTFILFKEGQAVDRVLGAIPKAQFQSMINRNL